MQGNPTLSAATRPPLAVRGPRLVYRILVLLGWLLCAWLPFYYFEATRGVAIGAATQVGRIYGLIGAVLFLFLVYYGFRRQSYFNGPGALEWWYRAHLLLGFIGLVMLGCHCWNLKTWTRSPFLIILQVGFWGTMATGVYGWVYLTLLKRWMVRHEYRPTVRKDLERERAALHSELDKLRADPGSSQSAMQGSARSLAITRALGQMAARRLGNIWRLPDWRFWEQQLDSICSGLTQLPKEAREPIQQLNRIEVLRSYHKGLRVWTNLHLVLAGIGVQMMLWHVYMVMFWPR